MLKLCVTVYIFERKNPQAMFEHKLLGFNLNGMVELVWIPITGGFGQRVLDFRIRVIFYYIFLVFFFKPFQI